MVNGLFSSHLTFYRHCNHHLQNTEWNLRYQIRLWGIFVNDKINKPILTTHLFDYINHFHLLHCSSLFYLLLFLLQILQLCISEMIVIVLFFCCCEVKFLLINIVVAFYINWVSLVDWDLFHWYIILYSNFITCFFIMK